MIKYRVVALAASLLDLVIEKIRRSWRKAHPG